MRLIDADAQKNDFEDTRQRVVALFGEKSMEACLMKEAINSIDSAPTIDPVKHGHWERAILLMTAYYFKCSICGDSRIIYPADYPSMVYCPSCGAKMDEEVSE